MTKNLYLELLTEELRPNPKSPTGFKRVFTGSGKCASFDEKQLEDIIHQTFRRYRYLVKLRRQAEDHSSLIAESVLKDLGIPYVVKTLVKKRA